MSRCLFATLVSFSLLAGAPNSARAQIPDHPSKLEFRELAYNPPKPADHRTQLSNGMIVYIQEDHLLPTLDVSTIIRTGTIADPRDKVGLAAMTGAVMRTGGTTGISGDDLDERLAFLGASLETSIRETSGTASLSVLVKDTDEGLRLLADVLMNPAFAEEKIRLYKDERIQAIKSKNDQPRSVLEREFAKVLYGDHPVTWEETQRSINSITRDDLLAFHKKFFAPNNMILAVAGDFDKAEMLKRIEAAFAKWPQKVVPVPAVADVPVLDRPGVFMVQKEINQGYVNVGHLGIKDTNPDIFPIWIMEFILGSGSFTSRITSKVRSDEGLAYNTGCRFANRHLIPGTFYGYVQTKSPTVPYAISLILNEFRRIQNEPVTDAEMETAKSYYLDSFPNQFSTPIGTMSAFARLEYDAFPMDYYETYRDKIEKVTKADVMRVAKQYLRPDKMTIFVVGDIEPCKAGYDKHPGRLEDLGPLTVIELKDPLTGE
ncbi:MAG: pitrilysin family protein [Planctomycetota bacterium]